jgi:transcriptional regulator with XRE-family HTH domain
MSKPTLTPNQIVAFNLAEARSLRGWTQEEAAERLEPYLGTRWSKGSFSAAERSFTRERVRQFTADDLFAFAKAFNLPVSWFLLPPDEGGGRRGSLTGEDLELLFGVGPEFLDRLAESLASLVALPSRDVVPDKGELTLDAILYATRQVVRATLKSELGALEKAENVMRAVADGLKRTADREGEISAAVLRRLKEVSDGAH